MLVYMAYCRLKMVEIDVLQLPRQVLEIAVMLRDPLRKVYLTLFQLGKPSSTKIIAEEVGFARAYIHMRLIELEERKLVKRSKEGRIIKFEVIK